MRRIESKTNFALIAAVLFLGAIGVLAVLVLTRWGLGLFDWDSFNYLAAARSFAHGQGLRVPLSSTVQRPLIQFAPLLPIMLSALEYLPVDLIAAARIFNALLFGINLCLFAALVWFYTCSRLYTLASAGLFLVTADLLRAHAWLLSEPLLITFLLGGLLTFRLWQVRRRSVWLWPVYASIALAVMTKFAGAALAPAIAVLFLLSDLPVRQKRIYAGLALVAALAPFLLWTFRTFALTSTFNGFGLGYVPLQRGNLITAFITLFTWFLPDPWLFGREKIALVLAALLLVVILGYILRVRKSDRQLFEIFAFAALFAGGFMAIVIIAKIFLDHGIGFRDRMLIPMFPFLLVGLVVLLADLTRRYPGWGRLLGAGILVYMTGMLATDAAATLPAVYENGLGWNSRAIVTSPAIHALKELASQGAVLYNNDIFGMYFHTGSVGEGLGKFPPEADPGDGYVVIFKMHLHDEHALLEKYQDLLQPLADDDVLSIHAYRPK